MSTIILATCAPFLPGHGFRAELHTDGEALLLYSWDRPDGGEGWPSEPVELVGPTLRARCRVQDYRPRAGEPDTETPAVLCGFWAAYADRPEEFDRDADDEEQNHRSWWARWEDYLCDTGDADGDPDIPGAWAPAT